MKVYLLFFSFLFVSISASATGEVLLYQEEVLCPQTPEAVSSLLDDIKDIQKQFSENLDCQEIDIQFDKLTSIIDGSLLQTDGIEAIIYEVEVVISNLPRKKLPVVYVINKLQVLREILNRSNLTQDNIPKIMNEVRQLFLDIDAEFEEHYFTIIHGIQESLLKRTNNKLAKGTPSRQDFLDLIFNNEGKTLSVKDALKIQSYSAAVTEEAGVLISMISNAASNGGSFFNQNACQINPEEEFSATERITNILYEASSFISKVAGPYGVPIQIGASVFSGGIKGLLSYRERRRNIDFNKGELGGLRKRQFYENSVCLLEKTNAEAQRILNPNRHLQRLLYVRDSVITEFQKAIPNTCAYCRRLTIALNSEDPVKAVDEISESMNQSPVLDLEPFEKLFLDMAESEALNIDWLNKEIESFTTLADNNANGIGAAEVIANLELLKKFLFRTASKNFLEYYQSKYKIASKELNQMTNALVGVFNEDLKVISEKVDFKIIPEGFKNYVMSKHDLKEEQKQSLYYKQSDLDMMLDYERYVFESVYPSVYKMFFINEKAKLISRYTPYSFSMSLEAIRKWQEKDLNLRVITEYCDFFRNVLKANNSVLSVCDSEKVKEAQLSVSYLSFSFAALLSGDKRALVESRDGPIDFNLRERFRVIKNLRFDVSQPVFFADFSYDFESLIQEEEDYIIFDGGADFLIIRGGEKFQNWHLTAIKEFNERLSNRAESILNVEKFDQGSVDESSFEVESTDKSLP